MSYEPKIARSTLSAYPASPRPDSRSFLKASAQSVAENILIVAESSPQAEGDSFERDRETKVMKALQVSLKANGGTHVGFGSIRMPVDAFNQRIAVRTKSGRRSATTRDVADAFGTNIETLAIAHSMNAERLTVADQIHRTPKPVTAGQREALTALSDVFGGLNAAQSALGTLIHHNAITPSAARQILWCAGEKRAEAERIGMPFAGAKAMVAALADFAGGTRKKLEADAQQQGRLRRGNPNAEGRLYAIKWELNHFNIASSAVNSADNTIRSAIGTYQTAIREPTTMRFIQGSARRHGEVSPPREDTLVTIIKDARRPGMGQLRI